MASSYGTDAGKTALRQEYLLAREFVGEADKARADAAIRSRLESIALFRDAELVLACVSRGRDVDTREIIASALSAGKRVALPRVAPDGVSYEFALIHAADEVAPLGRALAAHELVGSICLVPGLVFDADGHRVAVDSDPMDAFLAFYPGEKVGLARTMQLSSNPLPHEPGDIPVDVLVTECAVWSCR